MNDDPKGKTDIVANFDVGLKASAEFKAEIKTEIPKEDTGRLVAALTDVIRPFTEARGLKADLLRLQREDVLMEIAWKARQRAEIEHISLNAVPTKLLVPFMEKASTEDADPKMHDRWAALLISASKSYQAKHLSFVDILSRMSSEELTVLEETCFAYKSFPETSYPTSHNTENQNRISSNHHLLHVARQENAREAFEKFQAAAQLTYGGLIHASVGIGSGSTVYFYTEFGPAQPGKFTSLEILQRERLIDIHVVEPNPRTSIGYFEVTRLGISFVKECSPDADRMAARRPAPVQPRKLSPEEEREILARMKKTQS